MAMAITSSATNTKFLLSLTELPTSSQPVLSTISVSSTPKHNVKLEVNSNKDCKLTFCDVGGPCKWRTRVSFLQGLLTKGKDASILKEELFEAIAPLDRGAEAKPEDQERVDKIARELEAINKIKEPLKSNLLNGKWELLYTTSQSLLQTKRPKFLRPTGKIYQAINVDTLRAQNMETWPFYNQATANLVPLNAKRVAVKFDFFRIGGLIPIKSPGSGRGQLEITYLDEELRISRGNRGNLFILKLVDPTYRVPI